MLEWILKLTPAPLHNQQLYWSGISLAPASNIMLEWILGNSKFLWKFRVFEACWTGFLTRFSIKKHAGVDFKLSLAPFQNQQPYWSGFLLTPTSKIMLEWILVNSDFLNHAGMDFRKFRVFYSHQYQKPCWTGFLTWFTMLEWILKLTLAPLQNQKPYGSGFLLAPASNIILEWILGNSEFLWKFRVFKPCWTGF